MRYVVRHGPYVFREGLLCSIHCDLDREDAVSIRLGHENAKERQIGFFVKSNRADGCIQRKCSRYIVVVHLVVEGMKSSRKDLMPRTLISGALILRVSHSPLLAAASEVRRQSISPAALSSSSRVPEMSNPCNKHMLCNRMIVWLISGASLVSQALPARCLGNRFPP